jgi:hypothetical protein
VSGLFLRFLADLFSLQSSTAKPRETASETTKAEVPRTVGQGAANETIMQIAGVPNLFVDEGDHVVQFRPEFDTQMAETDFGPKMVPELAPHWAKVAVHRCALKEAIAAAICSHGARAPVQAKAESVRSKASAQAEVSEDDIEQRTPVRTAAPRRDAASDRSDFMAAVTGRITGWGVERFPRRKSTGPRFYESFALRLDTVSGEQVLQGEGLKEAIADCKCEVGDQVSVRRVRKVKVPAFDQKTGEPKIVDGKQLMWDKWIWSITS